MDRSAELGDFLRTRRAALQPDELGLRSVGGRRRVPGLRREELAQLAGVSPDYYVRMEQGRARNVSEGVLDAVARALQLTDDEHAHLLALARPDARRRRPARTQRVRPSVRRLLAGTDLPLAVLGIRADVLAWNRTFAALVADFDALPPERRNMARIVFLDEAATDLWVDWPAKARDLVGFLRVSAGRHPDDAPLAELIGELSVKSPEFRRLWATHSVRDKHHGTCRLRHPLVGDLTVDYDALRVADDADQTLISYSAEPGSPSESALRILAQWTAPQPERQPQS